MFCWLIGHNWVGGFDPHFQSCTRCAKVRPKKFKGAVECPFCNRPNTKPHRGIRDSWETVTKCVHCDKKLRWSREWSWDEWDNHPTLIIDFKMETGE